MRVRSLLAAALLAASVSSLAQLRPSQPEPPSGWTPKTLAHAKRFMVAAASPLAVDAGVKMLEQGGSAVDAMIATQLVLTLVEPQASGLGGGAFFLYYDAATKHVSAIDARETAPAGATPELLMKDGKPMAFQQAVVGGRSVGTPGTPRLLEVAHARHGKLPWAKLFEPAIALAENGFPLSPRVAELLTKDKGLTDNPAARAYFFDPDGKPKTRGAMMRNPELAKTLRLLAAKGADAYYTGDVATDIAAAVRGHATNPGTLSTDDLAAYRVRDVDPLCGPYRTLRVCGMPPSSSGGIAVLQILGVLEKHDIAAARPNSTQAVHLFAEAQRLAFADRNRYVGDDRYVDVPVTGLVDARYIAQRSQLVRAEKSMGRAEAGTPPGTKVALADDPVDEVAGTSQIAIVDAAGNAVSMTTTIEGFFGSKLMVRGFLLNNELTDFNFNPVEDGRLVANSVAPGKRPRSSMAPFLVFDAKTGALDMVVGSPGGSLIIGYVAKAIVGVYDWKLDMQKAIDLPNRGSRNGPTEIEKGTELEGLAAALKTMGHEVSVIDMTSGLQGIRRVPGGWEGGADPRREGVARGH
ncbi:Glutathione hydrolase proenzyme [Usitatibacter rugosus]|uniref:Glutathione hydrolase proenzyme n=1 Tax=Usitatibacter rugosus TaxID=2732067 RepID=A0A6M4GYP0_9PROT|nr:gamma-glutamyltransferase [Usitatibacter rugosus]QJR12370.1 Glutathione hydrolase proenzyme [Usitatibacter rugosus]